MKMTSSPYKKNTPNDTSVEKDEEYHTSKPQADNNFMSIDDVKKMVQEGAVDTKSFEAIDTLVAQASKDATSRQVGENSQFNHHNYYNGIRNKIVKNGNLRSLATNTNSFGRVFKKDLEESILAGSYEKMGIGKDAEKLDSMDPTPDTPITPEDAQQIARMIFQDEQLLGDYVAEYYTNYAEQNFNANLRPEVAQDFSWTQSLEEAKARATKRFGNGKNFTYQGQRFTTDTPVASIQEDSEDEFA